MPLNQQEIQELRVKRLSKLLDFYNMSQAELVRKSEGRLQASNLNSWIRGSKKITEATIQTISELFPEISESWLLGRSDYMMKDKQELIDNLTLHSNRRFFCPLELLESSIKEVSLLLGRDVELHDKDKIQELIDRLVSYSDFLIYEYARQEELLK